MDEQTIAKTVLNNGVLLAGIFFLLKIVLRDISSTLKELKDNSKEDRKSISSIDKRVVALEERRDNEDTWFGTERRRLLEGRK